MNSQNPPEIISLGAALSLSKQKAWTFLGALAVGGLGLLATAAFHRPPPPDSPAALGMQVGKSDVTLAANAAQWKVLRLTPVQAPAVHWSNAFPARFTVDEALAAKVSTPLAGRVSTVYVVLGQTVKSGQPLFSVTSQDIAGLRAEREKSAVGLDVAKAANERVKAMVDAKALPGKDALESDQQLREASLSLRLAETRLRSLKVSSKADNEFTVVSPRDGVVIEKNVLPSQQVDVGAALVSVADLSTVRVAADLFEADAGGIVKGTKALITSPSLPGFSVESQIEMVSSVADPERHTVPVWVRLPNADGRIRPNAYAEVRLETAPQPGTLEIPTSALVSDGAHQYVYVQDAPGHFVRRPVVAGSSRDDRLLIYQGLKAGEVVVEQGAVLLDNQIALAN
ncbi:MAG: efflux RND transporter periplasmic adaptor subunit [Polyangiaceae bacterium]